MLSSVFLFTSSLPGLLLGQSSFAPPTRTELMGMSPDQVIRMGREKWGEFHGKKSGWSTAAMVDAETLWGRARRAMNERELRRLSPAKRKAAEEFRGLMTEFHASASQVGYIMSGGGTLWHPIFASGPSEAEEVIARILRGRRPGRAPNPSRDIQLLGEALNKSKGDIAAMASSGGTFEDAQKNLAKLRPLLAKMESTAPKFVPGSSTHATVFASKTVQMVLSMTGQE
jgi:hypothetical protein